jgi:hypothetical protein
VNSYFWEIAQYSAIPLLLWPEILALLGFRVFSTASEAIAGAYLIDRLPGLRLITFKCIPEWAKKLWGAAFIGGFALVLSPLNKAIASSDSSVLRHLFAGCLGLTIAPILLCQLLAFSLGMRVALVWLLTKAPVKFLSWLGDFFIVFVSLTRILKHWIRSVIHPG